MLQGPAVLSDAARKILQRRYLGSRARLRPRAEGGGTERKVVAAHFAQSRKRPLQAQVHAVVLSIFHSTVVGSESFAVSSWQRVVGSE